MTYQAFPRRVFALWLLRLTLLSLLPATACYWLSAIAPRPAFAAACILAASYPLCAFYLFLRCRSRRYALQRGRLVYLRGVILRRSTVIPLACVMLLTQMESPLARLFGLSGVMLRGGRLLIYMEGLDRAQADALRTALG